MDIHFSVFDEEKHKKGIYELSQKNNFYPEDVFLNVYSFKQISPSMLTLIKNLPNKTTDEKNAMIHKFVKFLSNDLNEWSVFGLVAFNSKNEIVGYLLYTVLKHNPTGYELTFLLVDKEYRKNGIATSLMQGFFQKLINIPALVKVKLEIKENTTLYKMYNFKSADETEKRCRLLNGLLKQNDTIYTYLYYMNDSYEAYVKNIYK